MEKSIFSTRVTLAIIILCLFISGCAGDSSVTTIKVGAIVATTGGLSTVGGDSKASLKLAEEDANAYLAAKGANYRIALEIEEAGNDYDSSLAKANALLAKGVQFIIGPQSSSVAEKLKDWAASNNVILVSQSATSANLSIPSDNFYRLIPSDTLGGSALAYFIALDNISYVLPVYIDNTYGTGVKDRVVERLQKQASTLTILAPVSYSPNTTDFSALTATINSRVSAIADANPTLNIMVFVVGYNEVESLLVAGMSNITQQNVHWLSYEALTRGQVLANQQLCELGKNRLNLANYFAMGKGTQAVRSKLTTTLGHEPDEFSLVAYDTVFVIADTYGLNDTNSDISGLKTNLANAAGNYFGITGWTRLDTNGDRHDSLVRGDFLIETNGQYSFKLLGYLPIVPTAE